MLLLSKSHWNDIACALGVWGCIGYVGWWWNHISKIWYWARWFYAAGIWSYAKAVVGGIGFIVGYLLTDLATVEHSLARGCLPTSITILPTCFRLFEGVCWSTGPSECASFNLSPYELGMAATIRNFLQAEFWRSLFW